MKKFLLYGLMLLIIPVCGFTQSKTSITIKSMTIDNGDTTVSERTYNSDDDNIILNDSIFGDNNPFIFFNRDYSLDTNFDDNFDRIIRNEMQDFFQHFNTIPFDIPGQDNEFFSRPFNFDFDSIFSSENPVQMIPDTNNQYGQKENSRPYRPIKRNSITVENIIVPDRQTVEGYSITPGDDEGIVKIVFQLDPGKATQLLIKNDRKKQIYKEKIPVSKGVYTRLFDFSTYEAGTYYLELHQGKKISASTITIPEGNKNNFQFIF